MTDEPDGHGGVNEALIEKYFNLGDLKGLIAIFDHYRKATFRAEELSRRYLSQMLVLQKRLEDTKPPADPTTPRPARTPDAKPPKEKKSKGEIIDVII